MLFWHNLNKLERFKGERINLESSQKSAARLSVCLSVCLMQF